jgi:hypothetical protein
MDARLVIVKGKASKSEISLKLPTIIGRSREADLKIAHPMISRQHCQLYEEGGLLKVRDLGSLNGVHVEGQQVSEAVLPPESTFTVGPLTFRAVYEYAGELPDTPQIVPAEAAGVPDFQAVAEPADTEEESAEEVAEVFPADEAPGIVPPEGGMPDFSAWARVDAGEEEEEEEPEPTPPPTVDERTVSFEEEIAEAEAEEPEPTPPPPPPAVAPPEEPESPDDSAAAEAAAAALAEEALAEEPALAEADEVEDLVAEEPGPPPPPRPAAQEQAAPALGEAAGEAPPEIDFTDVAAEPPAPAPEPPAPPEAAGDEEVAEVELAEEAEEAAAEEEPARKKKGWWPFGKGRKKKDAEEPSEEAEAPEAEAAEAEAPPPPPAPKPPSPPAKKPEKEAAPDFLSAMGSDEKKPAAESDDDLNRFLKGLG